MLLKDLLREFKENNFYKRINFNKKIIEVGDDKKSAIFYFEAAYLIGEKIVVISAKDVKIYENDIHVWVPKIKNQEIKFRPKNSTFDNYGRYEKYQNLSDIIDRLGENTAKKVVNQIKRDFIDKIHDFSYNTRNMEYHLKNDNFK